MSCWWLSCIFGFADDVSDLGSLPPGVPVDIFARVAKISKLNNSKLIVDTSGEALELALNEGVYMIKPNLGELSMLVGKEELALQEIDDAARKIITQTGCEGIAISMGSAGAMMVTAKDIYRVAAPPVKRRSTVGAGDSMVAGIVYSLSNNKTLKEAIQYGVACGTAATIHPGTQLCKPDDVKKIYADIIALPVF